ncbi:MAG: hypothetical protein ACREBV_06805, partial [Candidatus Zixiibacteriota bacterium]
ILDSFEIWAFDRWPDDFPKKITDPKLKEPFSKTFYIDEVVVIKRVRDKYGVQFKTILNGNLGGSELLVPVAGDFKISKNTGTKIISGQLLVKKGYFDLVGITAESNYRENGHQLSIDDNDPDSFKMVSRWFVFDFDDINVFFPAFDSLAELGNTDAIFTIIPSIEVAREIGDIDKFWGHTLTYNIKFQAIDSTKVD